MGGVKIVEPAEGRLGSSRLEDLAAGGGQILVRAKRAWSEKLKNGV